MHWLIAGAGSIGCWLGGNLAAEGAKVTLLGRNSLFETIQQHGLRLTSLEQAIPKSVTASQLTLVTTIPQNIDADIAIVCVKSKDTEDMAQALLDANLPSDCTIISAQNGMRNATVIEQTLKDMTVHPMIVPYNVVNLGDGHFHRGTRGELELPIAASSIADALSKSGLPTRSVVNITSRMWGKLLMNLSNPINALADIPLREQLLSRKWRSRLSACIAEASKVLRAAGIQPELPMPIPASLITRIMELPTPLYRIVAAGTLKIDPKARSSMWEDIQAGRPTEIDYISGEIVKLGRQLGLPTPKNDEVIAQIRALEAKHNIAPAS